MTNAEKIYRKRYSMLDNDFKVVLQHKFLAARLKQVVAGEHWIKVYRVGTKIKFMHVKTHYTQC